MKKFLSIIMACVICLATVTSVNAATPDSIDTIEETIEVPSETNSVSLSKSFSINVGKSWSTSFTMNVLLDENHNAFTTVITDVSGGTYKCIITGSDGYQYTSDEKTGGVTITTTNAASGVTYTVYIVNTGAETVSGTVKISSYYAK